MNVTHNAPSLYFEQLSGITAENKKLAVFGQIGLEMRDVTLHTYSSITKYRCVLLSYNSFMPIMCLWLTLKEKFPCHCLKCRWT